jgi:hypothetical protein
MRDGDRGGGEGVTGEGEGWRGAVVDSRSRKRRRMRVRRKVFTFACWVLLVVWAGMVVVWGRSYWVAYACGGTTPGCIYSVTASRGRIVVGVASLKGGGFSFYHSTSPAFQIGAYGVLGRLGFFLDTRTYGNGDGRMAVVFPIAVPVCLAGILPAVWVLARSRRRRAKGRCRECFYDLTGNTSGVCPECGVEIGGMREGKA